MNDMILVIEPLIPPLRRYARSLLRDHAAADDLVQDCLERAISRWHQRRKGGDARAWVFAILHNLAINRLRTKARRGPHLELGAVDERLFAQAGAQEDRLRHRDLLRGLDALPDEQRVVLLLVSVEGLSYAETAAVVDIPIGTVMSRLARAREKLALALDVAPTAAAVPGSSQGPSQGPSLRRVK